MLFDQTLTANRVLLIFTITRMASVVFQVVSPKQGLFKYFEPLKCFPYYLLGTSVNDLNHAATLSFEVSFHPSILQNKNSQTLRNFQFRGQNPRFLIVGPGSASKNSTRGTSSNPCHPESSINLTVKT